MKRVITFVSITCLISWIFAGLLFLLGVKNGTPFTIMGMVYMLIPALVAIILQKFVYKESIVKPLNISFRFNKWFIVAILTPYLITVLTLAISLLFPNVHFSTTAEGYFEIFASKLSIEEVNSMKEQLTSFSFTSFILLTLGQALIAGCTINAFFAFGEELGWRGFMLHYLNNHSYFKISLITGIIWGIWHFPLILMGHNYPQHPVIGVFFMIIFCVLLSFIMTYIVLKSKSVITAALFHGNLNAIAGFPLFFMKGGNDLLTGTTGLAGFIAMLFIILLLFLYDKYISKEILLHS